MVAEQCPFSGQKAHRSWVPSRWTAATWRITSNLCIGGGGPWQKSLLDTMSLFLVSGEMAIPYRCQTRNQLFSVFQFSFVLYKNFQSKYSANISMVTQTTTFTITPIGYMQRGKGIWQIYGVAILSATPSTDNTLLQTRQIKPLVTHVLSDYCSDSG